MKQISICLILTLLVCSHLFAQETQQDPSKKQKFIENLQEKFSKRKFIIELNRISEKSAFIAKRVKQKEGLANDSELISAYEQGQKKLNKIIEQMKQDVNSTTNIIDFTLFNAKAKYGSQFDEAQTDLDKFNVLAMKKLEGEQASILGELISKFLGTLFPSFKEAEQVYLSVAKEIINFKLDKAILPDWNKI